MNTNIIDMQKQHISFAHNVVDFQNTMRYIYYTRRGDYFEAL